MFPQGRGAVGGVRTGRRTGPTRAVRIPEPRRPGRKDREPPGTWAWTQRRLQGAGEGYR
ncbi:hypothetical protein GCM10018793_26280 [Streptomyces sulfonofaciens]|uniref:Uncharacterized protein n=1 Tax=Streptomyces sulfonofaciens TaxID=68272 RepID=A0A919KYQ5_9ACTN|nr:hypothetical protein GCM10018793_26280 [Streptomyces sulfonofaciens]